MESSQIVALLEVAFPDCKISVEGGDGKFTVSAVGDAFDGLTAVKRQQAVYGVLNEHISSGAIHAVTMRLSTPAEQAASASQ